MKETSRGSAPKTSHIDGFERFRRLRQLTNHWGRPAGPRAYYWYLTFENSPKLRSLVNKCQEAISFPYYDLTPPSDLHLTLDRIGFEGDITSNQVRAIEAAAAGVCAGMSPFGITIGSLGGTSGAIGFSASPHGPIKRLRDTLRETTLAVYPNAPIIGSDFHPHVAIAYCNSDDIPSRRAVAAVEKLNTLPCVDVAVKEGALVLLERQQRAYVWQAISHIPLGG